MDTKTNASNVWPYVIAGSAIGGVVGYLVMTESGRKVRRAVTHPDELADSIEDARLFIESKARKVTGQVRNVIDIAKEGLEEGQRAYQEAEQGYQSQMRQLEGKNNEIASNVHKTVDNVNRTAYTVEQSVLDPIFELRALYKGFERGIRALLGHKSRGQGQVSSFYKGDRVSG
jgi:gas vesicle protein